MDVLNFLSKFWNTNYITWIWNRMLSMEIECFKTNSSFLFPLITHTPWWRSKIQIFLQIKSLSEDLMILQLHTHTHTHTHIYIYIYIYIYCYGNLPTHAWTLPTINSSRYCSLGRRQYFSRHLWQSDWNSLTGKTLIWMCCITVLFNSVPFLCLYFWPLTKPQHIYIYIYKIFINYFIILMVWKKPR